MEYLKLQQKDTGDINWIRASMHNRGVLVTLLLRCSALENHGIIVKCEDWSDNDWRFAFCVSQSDVTGLVISGLAEFHNGDLHLAMYDTVGQERLQHQRAQGPHGIKGGRNPKGNPKGSVKDNPRGNPKGSPHTTPHQCGRVASPKGSTPPDTSGLGAPVSEKMDLRAQLESKLKGKSA